MRTVKLIVLGLVAVVLVLFGVANTMAVDLHLLPPLLVGDRFTLTGVPLWAVIVAAILLGAVFGQLLEWFRERRQRAVAEEKRRQIAELRQEVSHLRARLGETGTGLPRIPAA